MKPFLALFLMRIGLPFGDWFTKKPAPQGDPVPGYIEALQRDGRLLLRHLARRSDVAAPEVATGGVSAEDTCTDALFKRAETIRDDPEKIAELVQSVDVLSRRARPANVRSIRLTCAYLRTNAEGGEPSDDAGESKRIRWSIRLLSFSAIAVLLLGVGLLADVDYGRRLLQQLDKLRQQERGNQTELSTLPPDAFEARPLQPQPSPGKGLALALQTAVSKYQGPFCRPEGGTAPKAEVPYRQPVTGKAIDLCRQADDLRHRIQLVYLGLADWNCWNYRVFPVNWLKATVDRESPYCGAPTGQPQTQEVVAGWRAHETRVSASLAVMSGFALPMMLGFLGGCAYVLRQHDLKLASWTLEPQDGQHPWLRVLLAALLGGLVGVIWTSDEPVSLGTFSLSVAAIAFFVGFSVEAVFRLIQTLIEGVVSTIRSPEQATVPSSPTTRTEVQRIARDFASNRDTASRTTNGSRPAPDSKSAAAAQAAMPSAPGTAPPKMDSSSGSTTGDHDAGVTT